MKTAQQGPVWLFLAHQMTLMMIDAWVGWLLADQSADRIEFWEGNILFYPADKEKLAGATDLMKEFECSLVMQ